MSFHRARRRDGNMAQIDEVIATCLSAIETEGAASSAALAEPQLALQVADRLVDHVNELVDLLAGDLTFVAS